MTRHRARPPRADHRLPVLRLRSDVANAERTACRMCGADMHAPTPAGRDLWSWHTCRPAVA